LRFERQREHDPDHGCKFHDCRPSALVGQNELIA
jgi:hypothetical protein